MLDISFLLLLFWRCANIYQHPVWFYVRDHIFNQPISDEPT